MKCRSRSCYVRQPSRLRWASIRSNGDPARAATRAGPFLTERRHYNHRANTRVGKGALCAVPTDRACRPAHRNGGHAIDRAFARPLSFAHPTAPLRRKSILTHMGVRRDNSMENARRNETATCFEALDCFAYARKGGESPRRGRCPPNDVATPRKTPAHHVPAGRTPPLSRRRSNH